MIVLRSLAAIVFVLAGAPAFAQTTANTGPRVEVVAGWDQLRYDLGSAQGSTRQKPSDLGYGVTVGYDHAVTPRIIVGVEGGATFSQGDYTGFPVGDVVHIRRDLSVAARVGTPIGSNALLYGKVGYSNLQLGIDTGAPFQMGTDPSVTSATSTYSRRDYDGVLLGVGAEVGLTRNTYLKGEYRYTDYEDGVGRQNVLTGIGIRF